MKATYLNVTMDGTPKEIFELIKLIDEKAGIKITRPPWHPPYQYWWGTVSPSTQYGTITSGDPYIGKGYTTSNGTVSTVKYLAVNS